MTVQIIRGPLVDAPTPAKRAGGLLDVAEVHEGLSWVDPNDMFVSWNCLYPNETTMCLPDPTPQKSFGAPTSVDGTAFAVYLGGQCKPLGADVEANISRVFDLRESRAVEEQFQANVLALGTAVSGTPVSSAHALALMENALADAYAGVGTIHMSLFMATLLLQNSLIFAEGGQFYTYLGTKVVVGSGYSSSVLYGTGDVVLYRGEKVLVEAPDTANNVVNVLAERAYVAVGDCVSLKIEGIPSPQAAPTGPGDPTPTPDLITGTATLVGPGASWTPPSGDLRAVTVVATLGSVDVDGEPVTAPHSVSFDADEGEVLTPPTIEATDSGDQAVVSWVVVP